MAAKKTTKIVETPIEEVMPAPIEEPVEKKDKITKYLNVIAENLNVRKEPSTDSEVLVIVSKDDKLVINDAKLVKGFYSVTTVSGVNGYVMKEFVVEE